MSDAPSRLEAFFAAPGPWHAELNALRAILRDCPVTEELKWNSPTYVAHGGNVATLWGMKDKCTVSFFKGVLLKDPEGLLAAPGDHSRSMRMLEFADLAAIEARRETIRAYVHEAVEAEKAGLKVDFPKDDLDYPEELVARLDEDPAFRAAFEALTPGRRRGYVLHFSRAKQSATRAGRIDTAAPRILEGKGMHDR